MSNYIELMNSKGTIYIKKDRVNNLAEIDTIVFDCDGVLIDVRNAYNVAIAATTRIIIEAFTGTIIPEAIFSSELNYSYKRTGGFNNDWSHAYALIMRILAEVPNEEISELDRLAEESLKYDSPKQRFDFIAGKVKNNIPIDSLYQKLMEFSIQLDDSGVKKVDSLLLQRIGLNIKNALKFRGDVGESIISTLFEELFLGSDLFKETFNIEPSFVHSDKGIVEASEIIIFKQTLKDLNSVLGGSRFGVASGSLENTAKHILKDIIDVIPEESQYWYDVVERDSKKIGRDNLHKPNPYSLLKSSESFNAKKVLYVGDTVADFLTARNAGEDYLFAGVYGAVHSSMNVMEGFLSLGSDIVVPTVNELPNTLRFVLRR